jgi:PD-(D/E)XK nuclease family transposase
VLKNLATLANRPQKLQEKVFQRLFETAEIAMFSPEEKEQYEDSLKSYRDLKNVIDTSFGEGKIEGKLEGKIEGKLEGKLVGKIEGIINALKQGKLTIEEIAEVFNTTVEVVLGIKNEYNL